MSNIRITLRLDHGLVSIPLIITFAIIITTNEIGINRSIAYVNTFALRLLQARRARGMSQAALARTSGVSQSAIASYESGTRKTAKGIFDLAHALQVDPTWLSMGAGGMEPGTPATNVMDIREPRQEAWPFTTILAQDYWSLSAAERAIVESTVRAMILTMRNQKP
ncbi:helix-turn-helix domain-containing protein [Alcaligenaceae bacterium CGII-47]|nr:helix-turn-helix domain-containing protein [Alcaligenaceae bacterium CGII-47]